MRLAVGNCSSISRGRESVRLLLPLEIQVGSLNVLNVLMVAQRGIPLLLKNSMKSIRKSMMVLSYASSGNARVEDLDLAWMLKRPGCLVLTYIAPKGILHHVLE